MAKTSKGGSKGFMGGGSKKPGFVDSPMATTSKKGFKR
jgi:hypothetical protein